MLFRYADVKYRDKTIEKKVHKFASADLSKYQVALDNAIMSYHDRKMNDVNKIIKEIWQQTYRGKGLTVEVSFSI